MIQTPRRRVADTRRNDPVTIRALRVSSHRSVGDASLMTRLIITGTWQEQLDAWDTFMRAASRPRTTRELRLYHLRRLANAHRGRDPFDLDFEDLLSWLAGHDWSPETRRSYRSSLRVFYGWARATGRIAADPAFALPPISVPRALPRPAPDHVVLAALERAKVRERLMVLLLSQTGMRRGELARFHTNDLVRDLLGWSIRVIGKGGRERLIPIDDPLARVLQLLPEGYAFPGRIDGHLSPSRVGKLVSGVLGPGWTAHTLRHRFATLAYSVERDLRAVQELLGHAKPETTAIYTQVPDQARRVAAMAVARSLVA